MIKPLLSAIFCCLFLSSAFAAQVAIVTSDRAIIYADRQMSAPIGYLKKGKKLKVGEVKRNKGRVLPVVVNGRIAYIKVADIQTSKDIKLLEKASERIIKQSKKKVSTKFELAYSVFASTYDVDSTIVAKKMKNLALTGIAVKSHLLRPAKKFNYRLGIEHLEGKRDLETIRILSFDGDKNFYVLDSSWFDLNAYVGGTVIPYAQYEVADQFTKNGYGLGAYTGFEMVFKFSETFHMHLDTRYKYAQLFGFTIPETLNAKWEPKFYGAHASIGFSYSY